MFHGALVQIWKLLDSLGDAEQVSALLEEHELVRWRSPSDRAQTIAALTLVHDLADEILGLDFDDFEGLLGVLERVGSAFARVRQIPDADAIGMLLEGLLYFHLGRHHPLVFAVLSLAGVFPMPPGRLLELDRFSTMLRDPVAHLKREYGVAETWDAAEVGRLLFPRLARLLMALGFPASGGQGRGAESDLAVLQLALPLPVRATIEVIGFRRTQEFGVRFNAAGSLTVPLAAGHQLAIDVRGTPGLVRFGGAGVSVGGESISARVEYSLDAAASEPVLIFGSGSTSRLTLRSFRAAAQATFGPQPDGELSVACRGGELVIKTVEFGSLLRDLLGETFRAPFEFEFGWTRARGLRFRGGAGLSVVLPVRVDIASVVVIDAIGIDLTANERGLGVRIGAALTLRIGPVELAVRGVGAQVEATFAAGNLGPVDLDLGVSLPDAIGISIEAGAVQGAGAITKNGPGDYSGFLSLNVSSVAVSALGVFRDTAEGHSFLVVITAEFPGIPIGFGFNLAGVGGLVGINRQVSTAALQRGVQDGSLAGILFPSRDALRNPANVLAGVQRVFPPAQGSYVVAPMVKLTWGTPTVVEIVLGIIIRFPELLIGLLGRVSVGIPDFSRDAPVRINVLIAGLLDPGQKLIDIRASLYDSRIVRYVIAGDMAFRMRWGDQPDFLFSLGGFHPRYRAPAGYPTLRRLSVSIGNDFGARLSVEAFLAVTSNTFQFGARAMADLEVASIFSVHGEIYVYGMVTFSPFSFRLDFGVHLAVRSGSTNLFSVRVEGFLEGPGPWRLQGSASISLWLFEVSANFDLRFGSPAQPAQPLPMPDVLPKLVRAFQDAANWRPELAVSAERVVTLGQVEGEVAVFDPMGGLGVRQKVCPLNRPLRRLEQVDLAAPRTFRIRNLLLGGLPLSDAQAQSVQEWFAPGQYQPLSQAEQLSAESFVPMDAGFSLVQDEVTVGASEPVDLGFEPILVPCDEPEGAAAAVTPSVCGTRPDRHVPSASAVFAQVRQQARAARQSSGGAAAYLPETLTPLVTMAPELHVIAHADTLTPAAAGTMVGATDSYAAHDRLQAWEEAHPDGRDRFQVVSVYLTRRAA